MGTFLAGVLVDIFDIQAVVGLGLLAAVIAVVTTAAVREHRAGRRARGDGEPLS